MACSKHRGRVVNNLDPQQMGRLQVSVPDVLGDQVAFAMPCVPYAGPGVGFAALPPIGANVWVEFENEDPALPIWTGCFWNAGELPQGAGASPTVKMFKTDGITLMLDDTPGQGFSLTVDGAVTGGTTLRMSITNVGIVIDNGRGGIITLMGPLVSVNNGAFEVQ
jgi:hypothetical protein